MQQHNNDATKQFMVELGKIIKKHRVAQRKTIEGLDIEPATLLHELKERMGKDFVLSDLT